jgi:hybrid cluster-associated redox disulfide protein
MNKKVKKEDIIAEVLEKFPEAEVIFLEHELHCVGCLASRFETIENGIKAHGKTDKEVREIIDKINKLITSR